MVRGGVWRRPSVRGLVVVLAVVLIAGISFAVGSSRAEQGSDANRPAEPTVLTEPVAKVEIEGTFTVPASPLAHASSAFECVPRSSSEIDRWVFTRPPTASGDTVQEGQVVAEISDRPVFVIQGEVPAYRSIVPGDSGADVRGLQEALHRLAFYDGDVDGEYGAGTWQAVAAMYEAAGHEPVGPSTELLDQIAAARAAVNDAADQASRATNDEEYQAIRRQHAAAMESLRKLEARAGPSVPYCEVLVVPSLPSVIRTDDGSVQLEGTSPEDAPPALGEGLVWIEFGAGDRSVRGVVSKNQAEQLAPGAPATFIDGDDRVNGLIETVSETAPFAVVVKLDEAASPSTGTSGRLEFRARSSDGPVLAISTGAPIEAPNGNWYVTRVERDGTRTRVEVELGSTDGLVIEVTSAEPELAVGDQLLVGTVAGR